MKAPKVSIVRANVDHSPFLAKVVLAASRSQLDRGPFDLALQAEESDLLDILEWMILSDLVSNCHFSKFLVAEADGRPVGALAGFDPGESDLFPLGAALADAYSNLGYNEDELPTVIERVDVVSRCFPPARPGTWVVEWVAVEEGHRSRGICRELLREIFSVGADRGLQSAQISTYLGNHSATAAYAKAGFVVDTERRDPGFEALLGVPGMVTLRCALPKQSALAAVARKSAFQFAVKAGYPLAAIPIPW